MLKPPVWEPRPFLSCCSKNWDSYEKQRRNDPKSLRIKSRAARPGPQEEIEASRAAGSAASVSLHCGSTASNRQLQRSAPARSAAGEVRERPLCTRGCSSSPLRPLPSVLGQRLPEKPRVRERSGKWRRPSRPRVGGRRRSGEDQGGEDGKQREFARHRAAAGRAATGLGERQPANPARCQRVLKHPFGLFVATRGTPFTAAGYCPGVLEVGRAGQ